MTNEQIIQWAREADPFGKLGKLYEMAELTPTTLERFAALVAAAEREECAKVCEMKAHSWPYPSHGNAAAKLCAQAIRARGEKGQS